MTYENIRTSIDGRVLTITLDRPQALNALNSALMNEVVDAVTRYDADPNVGCIVITGNERAFAAGADIKEMKDQSAIDMYTAGYFDRWNELTQARTPIIAAVAGYALGGGCELAMMCDLIIAADTARFGQPEITLGIVPGIGGTQRLTRAIGKAKAMEMILTGRRITAAEAEAAGLVARVVPAAELAAEAAGLATTIAAQSPLATAAAKELINAAEEVSLAQGLQQERRLFQLLFASADQKEGMTAFVEKRDARFTGR